MVKMLKLFVGTCRPRDTTLCPRSGRSAVYAPCAGAGLGGVADASVSCLHRRRVDQLAETGDLRISQSEVSLITGLLDEQARAFRQRPVGCPLPVCACRRESPRRATVSGAKCVVAAHAADPTGRWVEIIGLDSCQTEADAFYPEFLCTSRDATSSACNSRSAVSTQG